MKHLVIYAHPNSQSLNAHLKNALVEHLLQSGNQAVVRDLYELDFNPVLSLSDMAGQREGEVAEDVRIEQEHIGWADCVTFVYPIWWTGMPAMMKGYVDRVFSYGFAYRYDQGIQKGLLTGKQAVIVNTHGKSREEYSAAGMDKALLLTSDIGVYTYCGFDIKAHLFFDKADRATAETIEEWKGQVKAIFPLSNSSCDI